MLELSLSLLLLLFFPTVLVSILVVLMAIFRICRTIAFVGGFCLVMTPLFWHALYLKVRHGQPMFTGFMIAVHKLRMKKMQQWAEEYEEITLEK